jgi:hypothetical protein
MKWRAMVLVACSACTPERATQPRPPVPPSQDNGTRADSTLGAGKYDGYDVERPCAGKPTCVGVTGTGAKWWEGMERERIGEDARFRAGFERFRTEALGALQGAGVHSLNASALGGGCTAFGLVIELKSWRELDPAIVRIGAWMRDRDLREPVTFCVNDSYVVPLGDRNSN